MLVLSHNYKQIPLTAILISKVIHKLVLAVSKWFYQDINCDKPKGIPFSNREWNRNSAYIMSLYDVDDAIAEKDG